MKIIFNLHQVGLGNNGGSRTLIRCAETLAELGHEIVLSSNHPSRYTWHKISHKVKIEKNKMPPRGDVIIATGYHSVPSTIKSPIKHKFYYIRGFEVWQASEERLIESYRSLPCLVNSEWLLRYMLSKQIDARLLYPGIDDYFFDEQKNRPHDIGGLYHERHKTKNWQDVQQIAKKLSRKVALLNKDLVDASPKQAREFYNSIKVWIASTELEGLHNPPIESSLCGCALVCSDTERGGMSDYAIHEETSLVYPHKDIALASECVDKLLKDHELRINLISNMQNLLKTKIGTRKDNMKKLVKIIEDV